MKVQYLHEPTDLQCGQAVLAMVLNKKVDEIVKFLNNERETTLKEMKYALSFFGLHCSPQRTEVKDKSELPEICMLRKPRAAGTGHSMCTEHFMILNTE